MNPRWAALGVAAAGVAAAWLAMRPIPMPPVDPTSAPPVARPVATAPAPPAPALPAREVAAPPEPPPHLGDPAMAEIIEQQLDAAHPGLSVTGRSCDGGVCVTALSVDDARVADAIHSAALNVAVTAGQGLDAQPVIRWEVATGKGFLYFVPKDATPAAQEAVQQTAEANIEAMPR